MLKALGYRPHQDPTNNYITIIYIQSSQTIHTFSDYSIILDVIYCQTIRSERIFRKFTVLEFSDYLGNLIF